MVGITCGLHHACGVLADGAAMCWGRNHREQADAPTDLSPRGSTEGGGETETSLTRSRASSGILFVPFQNIPNMGYEESSTESQRTLTEALSLRDSFLFHKLSGRLVTK